MIVKDPVCGMEIDSTAAATKRKLDGGNYYFCSDRCATTFDTDPHGYAHSAGAKSSPVVAEKSMVGSATTGYNPGLSGPVQVELPIAGLTCSTCVTTVERSLKAVTGVEQVTVNFSLGKATLLMIRRRPRLARWLVRSKRPATPWVQPRCGCGLSPACIAPVAYP